LGQENQSCYVVKLCSNQTKDIKGYSEAVNRRTDNIMIKMKKGQKRRPMVDKTRHRQLDAPLRFSLTFIQNYCRHSGSINANIITPK
jgi:hypothetical protein